MAITAASPTTSASADASYNGMIRTTSGSAPTVRPSRLTLRPTREDRGPRIVALTIRA
jgi:hypothetical protein